MNEFKIDDTFFKDEIDYKDLDESIYTQFAKTMAKNVDIDLAKTPLVDILTGYTRYRILQFKIDKAIELKHNWQNIKENATIVFDNNSLIEFMNNLENILKEDK